MSETGVIRFGEFTLTLAPLALTRGGTPVKLRAQTLRLLALLAGRPGELVTHREIHHALWNRRVVDFSRSVHVCIRELRVALGDKAEQPHYVETVPREGYRFVARVDIDEVATASARAATAPSSSAAHPWPVAVMATAWSALVLLFLASVLALAPGSRVADENAAARDAYLRGTYLLDKGGSENVQGSVKFLIEALARDARHAPAHAALAKAYRALDRREESKSHALRALALAPDSADAQVQAAISVMQSDWDWVRAGRHLDRAIALDPRFAPARHVAATRLAVLGELRAALAQMEEALELDPASTLLQADLGWFLYFAGDNEAAIARCREALALDARHIGALSCLERSAHARQDHATAREAALRIMELWGANEADRSAVADLPASAAPRAYYEWRLRFFETYPDRAAIYPEDMADANAALGNYELAVSQLERAAAGRSAMLPFLIRDPLYAPLRSEARFAALRTRLGLPIGDTSG
jgi:DNA-binding winged helix-turn-helix (wHTH) protein/Tfp pilus assembly protein PilF